MTLLSQAIILLVAAVIAVPLCKRLGLGTVLGYLAAGIIVGPFGLGLIGDFERMLHFSEIGVVLLLFLIGLELNPSRLWVLRRKVFGLGSAQVLLTTLVLGGAAFAFGVPLAGAVVAGFGLALSSTAFVMPILGEKHQIQTQHGQSAFAILLFQDLAVIPLLAMVPLLAGKSAPDAPFPWIEIGKVVGALVVVVLAGRYLVPPIFRVVASADSNEIFTATALLVVLGTAFLMELVGLSMSLGAFLAGVLLAESEYRHELQADIEPFKGLLLGLFFLAVGMSANLGVLREIPFTLIGIILGFMLVKVVIFYLLGRLTKLSPEGSSILAAVLPQGGEFAFVLFGLAAKETLLPARVADILVVSVTASMILTPLLVALNERFIAPRLKREEAREFDAIEDEGQEVIIAGFGRFGQIVARVLRVRRFAFTAVEVNPAQVDFVRKFGSKVYFGDASRLEILRSAHADKAKIIVIAIDDPVASVRTAETIKTHFPHLQVFARARNRQHAYQLMALGVTLVTRETFLSSIDMSRQVLLALGLTPDDAKLTVDKFQEHDERTLAAQFLVRHDEKALIQTSQQWAAELQTLFDADRS